MKKTIIITVIIVLLVCGLAGCIVALVNITKNKPAETETGAKIVMNDGSYLSMKKNTDSLPDQNLVYEYFATGVQLTKGDQIGFKVDGQQINVFVDSASSGIDLTTTNKALYKVLVIVTGKYDLYLKNYKSGVWTVYMETEQVLSTVQTAAAVNERGQAITSGMTVPARMTFLRAREGAVEASVNVKANVTPAEATVKSVAWAVEWNDAESEWAADKDIADYLTVESDGLNATISCIQPFAEQIKLNVTVTDVRNNTKTATTTVDFQKRTMLNSLSYIPETDAAEVSADNIYVLGTNTSWNIQAENVFVQIADADNGWAQYKATVNLDEGDAIKLAKGDKSKYYDGWELWTSDADYAHVIKADGEGKGNLVIDESGRYDIYFKKDKTNADAHQIYVCKHDTASDPVFEFGEEYTLPYYVSSENTTALILSALNVEQTVGTVGTMPQHWVVRLGFTDEFIRATTIASSELTADDIAPSEYVFVLDEFNATETVIDNILDLPSAFVAKMASGEFEFEGNVMFVEFYAYDAEQTTDPINAPVLISLRGDNKIFFNFDFSRGIENVEIEGGAITL